MAKTRYLEMQLSSHILLLIEMTDETNQVLENYINFSTLPPEILYTEVQRLTTCFILDLSLTIDNIYNYYKLITLEYFIQNKLLTTVFKVPIVNMFFHDFYKICSIPMPHKSQHNPICLVSTTRTIFLNMSPQLRRM